MYYIYGVRTYIQKFISISSYYGRKPHFDKRSEKEDRERIEREKIIKVCFH